MKILVALNDKSYEGWVKYKSLKDAVDAKGYVDIVVYSSGDEDELTCIGALNELKEIYPHATFVYLRSPERVVPTIKAAITGIGGRYCGEEKYFLQNSKSLNDMVAKLDDLTAVLELENLKIVQDYLEASAKGTKPIGGFKLRLANTSLKQITEDYKKSLLEASKNAAAVNDIFKKAQSVNTDLQGKTEELNTIINDLTEQVHNGQLFNRYENSGIGIFPDIDYKKRKAMIRVKEIGNVPYTVSAMLGLREYIAYLRYKDTRLIVIVPIGGIYETQYKKFVQDNSKTALWVDESNYNSINTVLSDKDIIFTNYPTKKVLTRLIEEEAYKVFIVLDKLKIKSSHILGSTNKNNMEVIYALNSERMKDTYNLGRSKFFACGHRVTGSLTTIYAAETYPPEPENRRQLYLSTYSGLYNTLYTMVSND